LKEEISNVPVTSKNDQHTSESIEIPVPIVYEDRKTKILRILFKILNNKYYIVFMTILTVYALFGDDLRTVAFKMNSDDVFYDITTACMFFFLIEVIISSIAMPEYFLGFYFWLDIIATASLIFDIGYLWDLIAGTGDNANNA
jgi:hypothetical protein